MSDFQSAADFEKCLDTDFRVELESPGPIAIKLIAVTPRESEPHEEAGMERFSAVFSGPPDTFLPQGTYRVTHPEMGEFYVFLVPLAPEAGVFKYEAVYNYYRPVSD